jgi:hypothetical protein
LASAGYDHPEQLAGLPHNTSKMFQRDPATARAAWIAEAKADKERQYRDESDFLKYRDSDGKVADFHAQRHTYISGIVAGGASVKTAQELARHSTPVLTIGRYSHTRLHDLTGALEALPDLQPSGNDLQAQRATGTDGTTSELSLPANRQQLTGKTTQNGVQRGESDPPRNDDAGCRKVLTLNTLGSNRRNVSKVVRGGIEPPTHGFSEALETPRFFGFSSVFSSILRPRTSIASVRTDMQFLSGNRGISKSAARAKR